MGANFKPFAILTEGRLEKTQDKIYAYLERGSIIFLIVL
jgi:hypothetical protein